MTDERELSPRRLLGARWRPWRLPAVALLVALVAGLAGALEGASLVLLVLAAAALLAAVAALWSSLRILLGEAAPDAEDAYALAAPAPEDEQKLALLRSLDDLEHEKALGKISAEDFEAFGARYRTAARALLGNADEDREALMRRAEEIIARRAERGERSVVANDDEPGGAEPADEPAQASCPRCGTPNDPDARFCKKCGRRLGRRARRAHGRAHGLLVLLLAGEALLGPSPAHAQPMPPSSASASQAAVPDMPELPPGHPDISTMRAAPGRGRMLFRARANSVSVEQDLPTGTLDVLVLDADENPVASAPITLRTLQRPAPDSEAEVRQLEVMGDERGRYRFEGLAAGEGLSYVVGTRRDAAHFSSEPFALPLEHGVRALLHRYEATRSAEQAMVEVSLMVVLEIEEGSIAVDHMLRVQVPSRMAWVPEGIVLPLPEEHEDFSAPQSMASAVAQPTKSSGVEIVGTFAPGTTDLEYSYRIPLQGTAEQTVVAAAPARTTLAKIVVGAGPGMELHAGGFATPRPGRSPNGQRILVTERRAPPGGELPTTLHLTLGGLPAPSPARWVALSLAALLGLAGFSALRSRGAADRQRMSEDLALARDTLIDEIEALEQARQAGDLDAAEHGAARSALLEAVGRLEQRLESTDRDARSPAGSGMLGA